MIPSVLAVSLPSPPLALPFRRRRRTARRCNVHFYGRPNQAAAPVTHRRPIAPPGTVPRYSSSPFFLANSSPCHPFSFKLQLMSPRRGIKIFTKPPR